MGTLRSLFVQDAGPGRGCSLAYRAFHATRLPQLYSLQRSSYERRSFIFYLVVVMWFNIEFLDNPLFWTLKYIFPSEEQRNFYLFNQRKSKPMKSTKTTTIPPKKEEQNKCERQAWNRNILDCDVCYSTSWFQNFKIQKYQLSHTFKNNQPTYKHLHYLLIFWVLF